MSELARQLQEPFPPTDVEWRIGQSGKKDDGTFWAKVLAYITNRAIMERLDTVVGPANWKNEYREWFPGGDGDKVTPGVLCGLSLRIGGEWVTKWDGAEQTDVESVKGGLSAAMKRAAVQWGIGRYLYNLEEGWAVCHPKKVPGAFYAKTKDGAFYWTPPKLPGWALPSAPATAAEQVRQVTEAVDGFAATLGQPLLFPAIGKKANHGKPLAEVPHDDLAAFMGWINADATGARAKKYGAYVVEVIGILGLDPEEVTR